MALPNFAIPPQGVPPQYNRVKIFSETMHRPRQEMSKTITDWLKGYDGMIVDTIVKQSSDNEFHCLSVLLLCLDLPPSADQAREARDVVFEGEKRRRSR
jgi:hypothetical protein